MCRCRCNAGENFLLYCIIIAVKVCLIIPCKAEEPSHLVPQLLPPYTQEAQARLEMVARVPASHA